MRLSTCTVEVGLHLEIPAAGCPATVVGRKRVVFAPSSDIANFVGQVVDDGVFENVIEQVTGHVLTRGYTSVTQWLTQATGSVLERVGQLAYNTYVQTLMDVTRMYRPSTAGTEYPLVGRMTAPVHILCGDRGTNYLGLDFDLTLPIMPCANVTVQTKAVEVSPDPNTPELPVLGFSFNKERGPLFTCMAKASMHLMLPQLRLSVTAEPVVHTWDDAAITVWWSKVREYHRRLHVQLLAADGLTDCFDYVADIVATDTALEKVRERACFRRGLLYTVMEIERVPLLEIRNCS